MPTYVTRCLVCGDLEQVARIKDAAQFMPCPICGGLRPQVMHAPQFVEDRVRLWRGANGDRYSYALGAEMPDSRQARDRMAREKGVEFIGKADFLASNPEAKAAVEYKAHVDSGGAREESKPLPAPNWQAKPKWAEGLV